MKKKLSVTLAVLAFSIVTADIRAQSIKFNKPFTTTVEVISSKNDRIASAKKEVTLMSIRLTDKQIRVLLSHKPEKNSVKKIAHANIPNAVNLGMNNVPVLDQGLHAD